jgi:hypothetical protein
MPTFLSVAGWKSTWAGVDEDEVEMRMHYCELRVLRRHPQDHSRFHC